MEETGAAEGMVEALMAMALFCDRALRAAENTENGSGTPLDIEVSGRADGCCMYGLTSFTIPQHMGCALK